MYPNPLLVNGSISDLYVENDNRIHFSITKTTQYENINDVVYCNLNLENDTFYMNQRFNEDIISKFYQTKITLDKMKDPLIYLYAWSGWGYELGEILTIKNKKWEENQLFSDSSFNCSSVARTAILDWQFVDNDEAMLAFIYSRPIIYDNTTPNVITPVIYNTTTKQGLFMNTIFPEIENQFSIAPGDFTLMDKILALTWTRYLNYDEHYPYVAIKWNEGWQLYSFDNSSSIPIALIPVDNTLNFFYYEDGTSNNYSRIYHIEFLNSTKIISKEIYSFNGQIFFNDDAVCYRNNNYFFTFVGHSNLDNNRNDLYLGKYNGTIFNNVKLTNTQDYVEDYANCELGLEYLHLAWTSFYRGNSPDLLKSPNQVYYHRISLLEINDLIYGELKHISLSNKHEKTSNFSFGIIGNMFILFVIFHKYPHHLQVRSLSNDFTLLPKELQ